jgi:hypothetical protein
MLATVSVEVNVMEHENAAEIASLGGKARAENLSAEERKAIATVAAGLDGLSKGKHRFLSPLT